ncbi:heme ABC exporter ATP-binding protein CcmA [Faunimonas sp. B44]|uniref:heme ABC exporter ATP-binding protein CcmA n=1 Tax=Faunimonas sp. B44 TaxID=3461493 RepID=UPI0040445363
MTLLGEGLSCERGGRRVFTGIDFAIGPGEILALRGPNGAGKSSLLRMVAGLIQPVAGRLVFAGGDEEGGRLHYFGHLDALKPALTLRETLSFWLSVYGGSGDDGAIFAAAALTGVDHALDLPVGVLSAGQRRRAGLARLALAARPLWLLDEPTSALDRQGEALVGEMIAGHVRLGGSVIAATHLDLPVGVTRTLTLGTA